jgi:hypothetical protein
MGKFAQICVMVAASFLTHVDSCWCSTSFERSPIFTTDVVASQASRHFRYRREELYMISQACSSVLVPRSSLCAHEPATFSPYGFGFPWN